MSSRSSSGKRRRNVIRLAPKGAACAISTPETGIIGLTDEQCELFKPQTRIGKGQYASVYTRKDDPDRISKFTTDALDAHSASLLKGKKYRHLVRVDDVRELKGQRGVYGIIAEKLSTADSPDDEAIRILDEALLDYDDFRAQGKIGSDEPLSAVITPEAMQACDYDEYNQRKRHSADAKICRSHLRQMINAIDESVHAGILTLDLHAGNWGMRGKDHVILDFGHSTTFHKKAPKINLAALSGLRLRRKKR